MLVALTAFKLSYQAAAAAGPIKAEFLHPCSGTDTSSLYASAALLALQCADIHTLPSL
jgi:hypothetical protein